MTAEMSPPPASGKPRLRGVSHKWAFFCAGPLGAALVVVGAGARARIAAAVYAVSLVALLGVSALYHRIEWRSPPVRRWMRRLDHSMIFLLIAGTYTPFAMLALHGDLAVTTLIGVWVGALAGVLIQLVWGSAPKALMAIVYCALGWAAVAAVPQLLSSLGPSAVALLLLGGALYTAGAVVYAIRRPDPNPAVFGYHEIFHLFVLAAAALQYVVIAFWVLPQ